MGKMPFSTLFIDQWTRLPPALQADLSGKSVMITGANVGIGYETAKHIASLRPKRLVLACRDEKKGRDAIAAIEKETGYEGIELGILDQSKFSSVLEFARRFGDEPLDVLVANAGVLPQKFEMTEDGWETALQVNHLSTALLFFLLTPALVRTARSHNHNLTESTDGTAGKEPTFSRLVIVSSDVHFWTSFAGEQYQAEAGLLKTLNGQTEGHIAKRYFDSKLLNVLFTRALHTHLPPISALTMPLIPTAVTPGLCTSQLGRSHSGNLILRFRQLLLARTSEQGARQLAWAALGPDGHLEGRHVGYLRGAYVSTGQVREPSDWVIGKEGWEAQERLWVETVSILEGVAPEIRKIVDEYFVE